MRFRRSQLFPVTAVKGPKVIGNEVRDCNKIMSVGNPPGTKCDNNVMPRHTKEWQGKNIVSGIKSLVRLIVLSSGSTQVTLLASIYSQSEVEDSFL